MSSTAGPTSSIRSLLRSRLFPLVVAWMFVAGVAWADAATMNQYVAMLDASGTLATDSLPLKRSIPAEYSDARTWVRYAIAIAETGNARVRWTTIDNAPRG